MGAKRSRGLSRQRLYFKCNKTWWSGNNYHKLPHYLASSRDDYRGVTLFREPQTTMDEISGGSPYGTSTIAAGDGSRMPSENEHAMARFQGRHVATITSKLAGKR